MLVCELVVPDQANANMGKGGGTYLLYTLPPLNVYLPLTMTFPCVYPRTFVLTST